MGLLKRIGQSGALQRALGGVLAGYLKLVRRTNRFELEPPDLYARIAPLQPAIFAMWHGQHFMMPFLKRPVDAVHTLISRHRDGEINAVAAQRLGIGVIRGSGGRPDQMWRKGGVGALRELLRTLKEGGNVALTADIPKTSRVAGEGIVLLAQMSGRPIVPATVVTSRRFDFKSWDRASVGKPFGRGVIAAGEPIFVPRDADAAALEAARRAVEIALDDLHARAYARLGDADPGRDLGPANRAARASSPAAA